MKVSDFVRLLFAGYVGLLLSLSFASAALDFKLTAKADVYSAEFIAVTETGAEVGFDGDDVPLVFPPSNYISLYSVIPSQGSFNGRLALDSWNITTPTRVLNLEFIANPDQTGKPLELSVSGSAGGYTLVLRDYGADSARAALQGTQDLSAMGSVKYTVASLSTGKRYFTLTATAPPVVAPGQCGDKVCSSTESRATCPADCPSLAEQMCASRNGKWDSKTLVCTIGKVVVDPPAPTTEREALDPARLDTLKKLKTQAAVEALFAGEQDTRVSNATSDNLDELEGIGVVLDSTPRTSDSSGESLFVTRGCIDNRLIGIARILNWFKCVYVPRFLQWG